MLTLGLSFFFLGFALSSFAAVNPLQRRLGTVAYIDPALNGGSQLDNSPPGGEPLNVSARNEQQPSVN